MSMAIDVMSEVIWLRRCLAMQVYVFFFSSVSLFLTFRCLTVSFELENSVQKLVLLFRKRQS
jgi:hypothetical protein